MKTAPLSWLMAEWVCLFDFFSFTSPEGTTCTWANMVLCVHGVVSIHLAFPKPLDYCNRKSITDDGSLHQKVKLHIWTERLWYGEMAFMQRRAPEKHRYWYLILDASCLMTHGSLKVSLLWFLMDCNDHWCFCQRKILELELAHLENRAMLCKCIIHHSSFIIHVPSLLQSGLLQSQEHNR